MEWCGGSPRRRAVRARHAWCTRVVDPGHAILEWGPRPGSPARDFRPRLRDGREQRLVGGELLAQRPLELRVDLADPALGDAEDLADLAQGEVLEDRKSTRLNSSHANISYA